MTLSGAWYRANGLRPPEGTWSPPTKLAKPARAKPTALELKRARQARYYVRRKLSGKCKSCSNPLDNDLSRCEACREKRREVEAAENRERRRVRAQGGRP